MSAGHASNFHVLAKTDDASNATIFYVYAYVKHVGIFRPNALAGPSSKVDPGSRRIMSTLLILHQRPAPRNLHLHQALRTTRRTFAHVQ